MKKTLYFLLAFSLLASACSKGDELARSGVATIDNTTFQSNTYYIYGFSFARAGKVSTLESPGPDISIYVNPVNTSSLLFIANNLHPSFLKIGDFGSLSDAQDAFNNLKEVPMTTEWVDLAEPILPNQVWVYRSGDEEYTKIRIISTIAEQRMSTLLNRFVDYGECSFEWVHQPDGSIIFP